MPYREGAGLLEAKWISTVLLPVLTTKVSSQGTGTLIQKQLRVNESGNRVPRGVSSLSAMFSLFLQG
jgi:hypothetical protein